MAQNDLNNYTTEYFGLQKDELMFLLLRTTSFNPLMDKGNISLDERDPCHDFPHSVDFWTDKADNAITKAKSSHDSGNIPQARENYLKASFYYRNAEYFESPFSLDYNTQGMKCRDAFWTACFMFDVPVEIADIPYNNTPIPGYFLRSHDNLTKEKTIIITGGIDTSAEDLFMIFAPEALKRGYHMLVYDGPGQTGMQRYYPELTFRKDYEFIVKAAIDYILERTDVDMKSLSLITLGFGGYAGLRGAMHDKRVKSLVLNPPIVDVSSYIRMKVGNEVFDGDLSLSELVRNTDGKISPDKSVFIASLMNKFGAASTQNLLEKLQDFTIDKSLMERIDCPVLCMKNSDIYEGFQEQIADICKIIGDKVSMKTYSLCDCSEKAGKDVKPCFMINNLFDWLQDLQD